MKIEEPNPNAMLIGQAKGIEHSSHVRLHVNRRTLESTCG
jgi:hypothetical protein